MRRLVLACVACCGVLLSSVPAGAASVDASAWWWRLQTDAPVQLPPPGTVPENGLLVQGAPDGATAVAGVRVLIPDDETNPVLTLTVSDAQGADAAVIVACRATESWVSGGAQPWSALPDVDCTDAVPGELSADGATVTFAAAGLVTDGVLDIVIGPGTTDGQELDGTNGSSFSMAFEAPTDDAVATQPASTVTTTSSTTTTMVTTTSIPSSTGAVFTPQPSGGIALPPPAPAPVPTTEPASPEVSDTTPDPELASETAAPLPFDGRDLGFRDLLPLLLVLAAGPLLWAATRHPRLATLFAGAPGGTAPVVAGPPVAGAAPAVLTVGEDEPVTGPVLTCRDVSLRFGGLQALSKVDLDVFEGEIVGLIGPNGAGKSTLMECISGFYEVDDGSITYRGTDLLAHKAGDRAGFGIGRTLQNVRLFPYLTIVDNVRVALHRHRSSGVVSHAFQLPSARREDARLLEEARNIVDMVGMQEFADKFASELSYGTLRLLELACMIALKPTMLLLDEPASGISQKETEALGPLLRDIQAKTGATILIIEHDMPLIMSLCDRIYCLDAGSVLSAGTPSEIQSDERVIEAYLGTPEEQRRTAAAPVRSEDLTAETLLEITGLNVAFGKVQVLYDVDFHVRRGERVALLGTNGAGKSTILKAASGLISPMSGSILWKGEDITAMPADKLVRLGLGQVPGGRGLFPTLSVAENLRMGGYIYDDEAQIDAEVERAINYFPWIAERGSQAAGTLSGGEQQQLAVARALMSRPELLMIDELSLGLSPLIIEQLMETVLRLSDEEGLTVVIVEQQATAALGYTDRAYFMEKGEVRYSGPSAGLAGRDDLLRSVFLAGANVGFAEAGV